MMEVVFEKNEKVNEMVQELTKKIKLVIRKKK